MTSTYQITLVAGYSGVDHLAPILDYTRRYPTLQAARLALRAGRRAQGPCAAASRRVRCDILRSDGRRFPWER